MRSSIFTKIDFVSINARPHEATLFMFDDFNPHSEAALSYLEDIECTNPQEKTTDKPYELVERVDDVAHWWSAMVRYHSLQCLRTHPYFSRHKTYSRRAPP